MNKDEHDLVRMILEQHGKRSHGRPSAVLRCDASSGTHYTQLPEDTSNGLLAREWNAYRREVGRLLAEGHEGRHVLIKGEEIIGIFDSWDSARQAGFQRFLRELFFVHPIRTIEPLLRMRGINYPWPSCVPQLPPPG
jgi:hypothetical protein